MPTGAGQYDENGVWQYGEDDLVSLFSDFLNVGQGSVSDAITAIKGRLATLETDSVATVTPASGVTLDTINTSCRKDGQGNVSLTVVASRSSAITDGTLIATIPAGWRPGTTFEVAGAASQGGNAQACFVQVNFAGQVLIYGAGANNKRISFTARYRQA